jgi:hypothetical protein
VVNGRNSQKQRSGPNCFEHRTAMRCQRKRLHENPKQTGKDDRRLSRSRRGGAVTPTGAFLPSRTKTWGELPGRRPERALRNRDGNCYAETLPAVIYRVDMSNDSVPNFCFGLRPDSIVFTAPPSQGSDGRSARPIGRAVGSRGSLGPPPSPGHPRSGSLLRAISHGD